MIQITEEEYEALRRVAEAAAYFVAGLKFDDDEHIAPDLVIAVEEYERSKR